MKDISRTRLDSVLREDYTKAGYPNVRPNIRSIFMPTAFISRLGGILPSLALFPPMVLTLILSPLILCKRWRGIFRGWPCILMICLVWALWPGILPVHAQEDKETLIGKFDQWKAYSYKESGQPVCYVVSAPIKATGKYKKRGKIYAFVTHRPQDKIKGEFSLATGYTFKAGSRPVLKIGGFQTRLITEKDRAWTEDSVADKKLILAMKRGLNMVVTAVSSRGTQTTDTYSLVGFTAAYKAIDKQCPVP